jgi:hypothetical protein
MKKSPVISILMAVALLSGCSDTPDATATSTSEATQNNQNTITASNSSQTVSESAYPARYAELGPLIRAQMQGMDSLVGPISYLPTGDAAVFDMFDCYNFADFETRGNIDYIDRGFEYVARRIQIWRNTFEKYGYDKEIYDEELQKFELQMITFIEQTAKAGIQTDEAGFMIHEEKFNEMIPAIAERIEARRQTIQPDKPPLVSEGGCGDGESPTLVNITPKGARLWLIEDFDFKVCTMRFADPWNRDRCSRWWEVNTAEPTYLSGTYRYQALWPGSQATRGQTQVQPGKKEGNPAVIKISQP